MGNVAVIVVVVVAVGVGIWLYRFLSQRAESIRTAWEQAAKTLNVESSPETLVGNDRIIEGEVEGHRVEVTSFAKGNRDVQLTYTRYKVIFPSEFDFQFLICNRGQWDMPAGVEPLRTSNSLFDGRICVWSEEQDRLLGFLTDRRKEKLFQAVKMWEAFRMTSEEVVMESQGVEGNAALLAERVLLLVGFAKAICIDEGDGLPRNTADSREI